MNERLKQLAAQAGIMVTPWYRDEPPHNVDLVHMDSSIQLEKFAELIVKECLSVQNKCPHDIAAGKFVRNHFGIEK